MVAELAERLAKIEWACFMRSKMPDIVWKT